MTIAELHRQPLSVPPKDVFSLPAESFIDAWAKALDLTERDLSPDDRLSLASAIRGGTNRLRIVDALKARRPIPSSLGGLSGLQALRREPNQFAMVENFVRFAREDDAAFLRFAFSRICGRDPTSAERLELEFDLRRGVLTRTAVVKRIVAIARRDGQTAYWDTLLPDDSENEARESADFSNASITPSGLLVNTDGQAMVVFVREVENIGWMIGPDLMRQPLQIKDGNWSIQPGWLLTGPKRSFADGDWLLDIDLIQPQAAKLDIEIVANSGLDILQAITLVGSFSGTVCIAIKREHRFLELRIRIHERSPEDSWLRPRNISMRQVS